MYPKLFTAKKILLTLHLQFFYDHLNLAFIFKKLSYECTLSKWINFPSLFLTANWSRKYDGNIRPRTGLVFVEPRVYEDLVREEKEAKQRVSAQIRHQYMNGSVPSTSSGQRLVNGTADGL